MLNLSDLRNSVRAVEGYLARLAELKAQRADIVKNCEFNFTDRTLADVSKVEAGLALAREIEPRVIDFTRSTIAEIISQEKQALRRLIRVWGCAEDVISGRKKLGYDPTNGQRAYRLRDAAEFKKRLLDANDDWLHSAKLTQPAAGASLEELAAFAREGLTGVESLHALALEAGTVAQSLGADLLGC